MDKEAAIGLAKRFSELVSQHMPARHIVLYGSYAKGTAGSDSDIDIAVIVDKVEGDYLDQQAKLYRLRRSVDLRIEPVLIEYGQDRADFSRRSWIQGMCSILRLSSRRRISTWLSSATSFLSFYSILID